LKHASYAAEI